MNYWFCCHSVAVTAFLLLLTGIPKGNGGRDAAFETATRKML